MEVLAFLSTVSQQNNKKGSTQNIWNCIIVLSAKRNLNSQNQQLSVTHGTRVWNILELFKLFFVQKLFNLQWSIIFFRQTLIYTVAYENKKLPSRSPPIQEEN